MVGRRRCQTAGRKWDEREEIEGGPNAPPVCLGGKTMKEEEQEEEEQEEAEYGTSERAAQLEGAVVEVLAVRRVPSPLSLSLSRAKGSQTSVLPLYGERESMLL
jgi:hypothetical protein